MLKKTVMSMAIVSVLSGCASGPKSICTPDTKAEIGTSEVEQGASVGSKVVVLPVDIKFKDSAAKNLQAVLLNDIETQIHEIGPELIDRDVASKLKEEIQLAEQTTNTNSDGVKVADYAVLTEVSSSQLKKSFTEAYSYTNKKGETVRVPAKCSYRVDVKAVARVLSLPSMTLQKRVPLSGSSSSSTQARSSKCPLSDAEYSALAVSAASKSVNYTADLKEFFAPSAPIMEMRTCEEGSMVKIGMGRNQNIQPNAKVSFMKAMAASDGEIETFGIGEGTVVNIPHHGIKENYSWVAIDEETSTKVQKGNLGKVQAEACDSLFNLDCQLQQLTK